MAVPSLRPDLCDGAVVMLAPECRQVYTSRGERLARPDIGVRLRYHDCGQFGLAAGQVLVGDPLAIDADQRALRRAVPAGTHRLFAVAAETTDGERKCAFGGVVFEERAPTRYVVALLAGESRWRASRQALGGVGTDSAMMGVVAAGHAALLGAVLDRDSATVQRAVERTIATELGGVATIGGGGQPISMAVWHAGFGDGSFTAYWGLTGWGRLVSLVIDFDIVANGLRAPAVPRDSVGDSMCYEIVPDARDA